MPGGRPNKFKSPEEMQTLIDEYFDKCKECGDLITITGLAIHLDTTRDTLMDYQRKPEFSDTVKKAKQRVENDYEISLRKDGGAGNIFALKNFGWRDKQEIGVTDNDGNDKDWSVNLIEPTKNAKD